MDVPLISVIIPVYNVEEYIEHCIKNILLQTYTNIEVIIVNDGSLDDSITIAKKLTEDDSRFSISIKKWWTVGRPKCRFRYCDG